jgi:hypothetical protein
MKSLPVFFVILIPFFLLTSCFPSQRTTQPPQGTAVSTATLKPTDTYMPVFTQTPIPTLDPESVNETVQPFLQDPLNCESPCFWGFIPGETSMAEVKAFFDPLGFTHREGKDWDSGNDFYAVGYDESISRDSDVTFFFANNLLKYIMITPNISFPKQSSSRDWIAYSPDTLIKKYGSPSRVQFAADFQQRIGIDMIMYFDTSNVIAQYSGIDMDPSKFCPLIDPIFDSIRLWIGPDPTTQPSFETIPLEKATSLTTDEFAKLMLGNPQNACIKFNNKVFYYGEP